jgi:hypothetical protein
MNNFKTPPAGRHKKIAYSPRKKQLKQFYAPMIKVIYADINFQEFKLRFKKERFTIGIVKLPLLKLRSRRVQDTLIYVGLCVKIQ